MISFMLATLGSTIFWVIYVLITLVMGLVVIKRIYPCAYEALTTGHLPNSYTYWAECIVVAALVFIAWPVIIVVCAIWFVTCRLCKIIFVMVLGPIFVRLFGFIAKITPDIKISVD